MNRESALLSDSTELVLLVVVEEAMEEPQESRSKLPVSMEEILFGKFGLEVLLLLPVRVHLRVVPLVVPLLAVAAVVVVLVELSCVDNSTPLLNKRSR